MFQLQFTWDLTCGTINVHEGLQSQRKQWPWLVSETGSDDTLDIKKKKGWVGPRRGVLHNSRASGHWRHGAHMSIDR